jgi:ABC-type dipeptide/oligopeptide/nickel transport system permease component
LLLIPVIIGVSILTFVITRAAGDPAFTYLTNPQRATPDEIQSIRDKYHLEDPLYVQYFYWFNGVVRGDLGYSQTAHLPVTDAIKEKFPATFELAIVATLFAVIIGIYMGTLSAVRANSAVDQGTRVVSLVAVSIPVFWLGLMLLMILYYQLGIAPAPTGRYATPQFRSEDIHTYTNFLLVDTLLNGRLDFFWDVLKHLILPAVTLAFATTAIIVRMMRSSMLEVLGSEYVKTARSKGLSEKVVINKHARRNALIPTTTVIGLSFGGLLGGAVLTETIFNWPGLGQWSAVAATNLDTAGIMGFTLLTAVIYVMANLVVDLVYAYLDPRVRLG